MEIICNKIIIIDGGRIKAADTPAKLIADMRAAGHVTAQFRGPADIIGKELGELKAVKKVSHEFSHDGWDHFSIFVESGTDARERIADLARKQNWPLRSLYRHDATLEDVFVELTRKD